MVRRLFWSIVHLAAACLLLAGLLVAAECYLLHDEADQRRSSDDEFGTSDVVVCSTATHHTLRPQSVLATLRHTGEENRVVLNSFGLRGAEPAVPKPADLYRVLLMGDETIFAPRLTEEETTSHQLQQLLQQRTGHQVEVVNAGVPGYCPLLSLLQFRHNLAGMHPDLVVLAFALDDPTEDRRYRPGLIADQDGTSLSCFHSTLAGGCEPMSLGKLGEFAIGRWAARHMFENATQSSSTGDRRFAWLSDQSVKDWKKQLEDSIAPIGELASITRQLSVRFILTTTPMSQDLAKGSEQIVRERSAAVQTSLRQLVAAQRIEFCDTSDILADPQMLTQSEPGLTVLGHNNLAIELADHISGIQRQPKTSRSSVIRQVSAAEKMVLPELD